MLYRKYPLFDSAMEIMLPSSLIQVDNRNDAKDSNSSKNVGDTLFAHYAWVSEDRRVVINVTKGYSTMSEGKLIERIQNYYEIYRRDIASFNCKSILKKSIYGKEFGEMVYTSATMGHDFYNVLLTGVLQDGEVLVTLQCLESELPKYERIFSNIVDSIKISACKQNGE